MTAMASLSVSSFDGREGIEAEDGEEGMATSRGRYEVVKSKAIIPHVEHSKLPMKSEAACLGCTIIPCR